MPTVSKLTAQQLREEFFRDIPLEDSRGRPVSDAALEKVIGVTEAEWTRMYSVLWTPTTVVAGAVPPDKIPPDQPTLEATPPSFDPEGWHADRWHFLKLPYTPVRELHYVGLGLGGGASNAILVFPPDWWQLNKRRGTLQLFPAYQQLAVANISSFQLSVIAGARRIPNAWRLCLSAGYDDVSVEQPDLAYYLLMAAAIKLLPKAAMLREGVISSESVSVDGLSQSRAYPVSGQTHRYSPYQKSLEEQLENFKRSYFTTQKGLRMFSA
ncbi:hypothetical protein [Calidithermus chliarophilus]|uniref:hypothetical protein n=1 Tax=Calidithermus chliarophilus TaxID=52023 RepID=UPI000481FEEA|nr:hypothetical protein [Calidithermus chliarophilus]